MGFPLHSVSEMVFNNSNELYTHICMTMIMYIYIYISIYVYCFSMLFILFLYGFGLHSLVFDAPVQLTHYHTCITLPRWGQGESWRLCLGRWRWGGGVPRWRFVLLMSISYFCCDMLLQFATYLGNPRIEGLCMSRWNFQVAQYVIWHVHSVVQFGHCFWPVSLQELLLHRNTCGIRMNQELFSFYSTSAIFLKRCTSALGHQKVTCVGTLIHEQFPMELSLIF